MPRCEARIFTSIWRDPHFLALEPGAQRMYMFLLSQDDLSYCGVMPLRPPRWASKAAGLTVADVERDLKALETAPGRFIITDAETGELFVRSLLRRDGAWKQPNLLKQARESAETVESPSIKAALAAELRRLPLDETPSDQVRTLVADFLRDIEQGSRHPSAYPPGDPTDKDYACAQGVGESNGSSGGDPPIPLIPEPPSLPAPPARDRKKGTRLPEPFEVTPPMRDWFGVHCPHVNARTEHERFLDYWRAKPGKDGCKLDWPATWRNWMRTAEDRAMPRARAIGSRQQETDDLFDRAARRLAEREAAS